MCKKLRPIGVVGCMISTALLVAGALTDHWVNSDNGHWGLWEICDDSIHNTTITNNTSGDVTRTPRFGGFATTTTMKPDKDDDGDDDDDEEDDSCLPLDIASLPAFLHIVRAIMVLAVLVLGWGMLSGRSLHMQVFRGETFFEMHKSELLGCGACAGVGLAVYLFSENYKTVDEDQFTNRYLDYSFYFVRFSLYLYFPAALLMMSPSLQEKFQDCSFDSICVNKPEARSRSRPATSQRTQALELVRRHSAPRGTFHDIDRNSNISLPVEDARIDEIEGGLAGHDISLQMSETDSDIFMVTFENNGGGNGYPSGGSDLPQYEDVARSSSGGGGPSSVPPPPSYQDVLSGGYLSFAPSTTLPAPSAPPPPPHFFPPTSSTSGSGSSSNSSSGSSNRTSYGSRTTEPPPPAYEYRQSNA